MHKRFDTGKQPYEAAKDTQATAHSQKPLDFVRLSSQSTRDHPRLLGGTPDDARKYLDNLEQKQREEYNKFIRSKSHHGTEIAKKEHEEGHKIYLEYMRKYEKDRKEGSSSMKSIEDLNKAIIEDYPAENYTNEIATQAKEWQQYLAERPKKERAKQAKEQKTKNKHKSGSNI